MNIKVDTPYNVTFLDKTLIFLSGMWLGVPPSPDSKRTWVDKETGLHAQHIRTIVGSIVNIIGGIYMTI